MIIPFHRPFYDAEDLRMLGEALRSGQIVGDGPHTTMAATRLAALLGVRHVLLTTSCTHALELAVAALRVTRNDEVIVPSFTFVSTTNCVLRQGARLVFADINPATLTLDPADVERRLTPRTRVIIPVAYAGVSPDMEALNGLARPRAIAVLEDAAQALGATYRGRHAGTIGTAGCFSFHETKNISIGEGGAFVTDDSELASRAEIIREKGTNRKQFLQGLVDKYTWVDVGSSYLPSDLLAALLLSQLDKLPMVASRRATIYARYLEAFSPLADGVSLTLPVVPPEGTSNHHIFHVLVRDEPTRNRAITFFRARGIGTAFHYLPLHVSPVGRSLGYRPGDFPVTESASERLLRLPIYPGLTQAEQDAVIETMGEFLRS
jgi:dTDP-4-amino-4,6-dideoxygalactose transaminase